MSSFPPRQPPHGHHGQHSPNVNFPTRPPKPTLHPRKVVGGVRLRSKDGPDTTAWAGQRWMRLVENSAEPEQLAEGLTYAKLGQTRALDPAPGIITAKVQGRMPQAYVTTIRLPTFAAEQWEAAVDAMCSQARYSASLLAGDLPADIEDVFAPLGLRLLPVDPSELAVSCTCEVGKPFCKHVCCAMALIADRFGSDRLLIFRLRGLPGDELIERIAQRRAAAGAAHAPDAAVPIYAPQIPGVTDIAPTPLDASLDKFWDAGPELDTLELPIEPPVVSHPMLRRLGSTPFEGWGAAPAQPETIGSAPIRSRATRGGPPPAAAPNASPAIAKFPLVGLLATCYDVAGNAALNPVGDVEVPVDETEQP
jgi:uncharacterized Zn finger protein